MGRWVKSIFSLLIISSAFFLGTQWKVNQKLVKKLTQFFYSEATPSYYAVTEHKPFVIIIPSYNNSLWVEKNLKSVFEQKYDNYRVVYVDDASTDSTLLQAEELIRVSQAGHRCTVISNEANRGAMENIYRIVHQCEPGEIALVLDGDDWFAHDRVLEKLNETYADPQVWATWGSYVEYPNYSSYHVANFAQPIPQSVIDHNKVRKYSKKHWCFSQLRTFYVDLFHQLKLKDLVYEGKFADAASDVAFFVPLVEMAGPHARYIPDILYIWNRATPLNDDKVRGKRQLEVTRAILRRTSYQPLNEKFREELNDKRAADLIVFSYDRPLQLYALLESVEKYCHGIDQITVIYRSSGKEYDQGYAQVNEDFPQVNMVRQSGSPHKDFQSHVIRALKNGESEYFLFAVDDDVITDEIDLHQGIAALRKTDAYGFFYRLGKEIDYDYMLDMAIQQPSLMQVDEGIYAWMFKHCQGYWGSPTSTDFVLYKKGAVLPQLEKISFANPMELEAEWAKIASPKRVGLCYETSRMVNIPLNLVHQSTSRNSQSNSPRELVELFNDQWKMDIAPLTRYKHHSAHIDYQPSFIERKERGKI